MNSIASQILKCQDERSSILGPITDLEYCSIALAAGNVRRIRLPAALQPEVLMAEIEAYLEEQRRSMTELRYWAIHPSYRNEQLESHLTSMDMKPNLEIGMTLGARTSLKINNSVSITGGCEAPEAWVEIQETVFRNDPDVRPADVPALLARKRRMYDDPRVELYIARLEGKTAGRMALFTCGDVTEIDEIYTLPEFRRQQVATTMMAHLIKTAKSRGLEKIIVVAPAETETHIMCRRAGFIEVVSLMGYYRPL